MANCDTNIIQLNQTCDTPNDIYVSSVDYNSNNGLLRVTLTDGTEYDVTITSTTVTIDPDATNQLEQSGSGLYVGGHLVAVNGENVEFDDSLILSSSDNSINFSANKVGSAVTIDMTVDADLETHAPVKVVPNTAYAFNPTTQQLNLPLPTFSNPSSNQYYFATNDGSGTNFTITVHPALSVSTGAPYSFNAASQNLVIPIATLTNNGDGTYLYNPGDGTAPILIEASGAYDNSGSDLVADTLQDAVDELANINTPFAVEGGAQGSVDNPLTITDDIYRTGSIGFGLNNTDTIQGILHARGDIYYDTSDVYFLFGTGQEFRQIVEELASSNQYKITDGTRTTIVVDNNGNFSTDDIPTNTFGAANTLALVDNNNSEAPALPLSVNHITHFAMEL